MRVFAQNAKGLSDSSDTITGRPAGNSIATGMPTISGILESGRTLTASISAINDADGIPETGHSYRWISNSGAVDAEIEGATQPSYLLTEDDVGKFISVRVSFVDKEGFTESLMSEATAAISAAPQVVWEGVLTAQEHSSITPTYSGYSAYGSLGGTLMPSEFTWNGVTYTIYFLVIGGGGLHLGMGDLPAGDFVLQVGDASYLGSTSSKPSAGVNAAFFWPSSSSIWSVDNPVNVSLVFNGNELPGSRPPAPLMAYFVDVPESHDGHLIPEFRLYFSEGTTTTADAMSQHLVVNGGRLVELVEVGGDGRIWSLTIRPNHGEDVSVVLPAETDCGVQGAACTEDGRMFSDRLEISIQFQYASVAK